LPDFNIYAVNLIMIVIPVFLWEVIFSLCSENLQFFPGYIRIPVLLDTHQNLQQCRRS